MMKLKILNIRAFLRVVDACRGAVYWVRPDGTRTDIRRRCDLHDRLVQAHRDNGGALTITIRAAEPSDHMALVSYYAGDC